MVHGVGAKHISTKRKTHLYEEKELGFGKRGGRYNTSDEKDNSIRPVLLDRQDTAIAQATGVTAKQRSCCIGLLEHVRMSTSYLFNSRMARIHLRCRSTWPARLVDRKPLRRPSQQNALRNLSFSPVALPLRAGLWPIRQLTLWNGTGELGNSSCSVNIDNC